MSRVVMKASGILVLALCLLAPLSAPARQAVREQGARGSGVTLERAVSNVRRDTRGRVLSADTEEEEDGREVHRIRVLDEEGRVRQYSVDPDTGDVERP